MYSDANSPREGILLHAQTSVTAATSQYDERDRNTYRHLPILCACVAAFLTLKRQGAIC